MPDPCPPSRSSRATWSLALSAEHLVAALAHQLRYFLDEADLRQAGLIGLYRAAERFDPSQGDSFPAYARWWIRAEMTAAIEQSRAITVRYSKVIARIRQLEQLRERNPDLTEEQIARHLGLSEKRLAAIQRAGSLVEPVDDFDEEAIWTAVTPEQIVAEAEVLEWNLEQLEEAMLTLPSRMRRIVVMYFGLVEAPPRTLAEISLLVGRTEERTRQLLHVALLLLRRQMEKA